MYSATIVIFWDQLTPQMGAGEISNRAKNWRFLGPSARNIFQLSKIVAPLIGDRFSWNLGIIKARYPAFFKKIVSFWVTRVPEIQANLARGIFYGRKFCEKRISASLFHFATKTAGVTGSEARWPRVQNVTQFKRTGSLTVTKLVGAKVQLTHCLTPYRCTTLRWNWKGIRQRTKVWRSPEAKSRLRAAAIIPDTCFDITQRPERD